MCLWLFWHLYIFCWSNLRRGRSGSLCLWIAMREWRWHYCFRRRLILRCLHGLRGRCRYVVSWKTSNHLPGDFRAWWLLLRDIACMMCVVVWCLRFQIHSWWNRSNRSFSGLWRQTCICVPETERRNRWGVVPLSVLAELWCLSAWFGRKYQAVIRHHVQRLLLRGVSRSI